MIAVPPNMLASNVPVSANTPRFLFASRNPSLVSFFLDHHPIANTITKYSMMSAITWCCVTRLFC